MSHPGPGRDPGTLVAAITVIGVLVAGLLTLAAFTWGAHP